MGDDLVAVLAGALVERRLDLEVGAVELDLVDLAVVDVGGEGRGVDLVVAVTGREELDRQEHREGGQDDPQPGTLEYALHRQLSPVRS